MTSSLSIISSTDQALGVVSKDMSPNQGHLGLPCVIF